MGLETATTIDALNETWPLGTDGKNQGDDHLRLIKNVLKETFSGTETSLRVKADDVVSSVFRGPTTSVNVCTTDTAGAVRLRPNGEASTSGEVIAQTGQLTVSSAVITSGTVASMVLASGVAGAVRLRPNGQGSTSGEFVVQSNGNISAGGSATIGGDVVSSIFRGPAGSVVLSSTDTAGAVHLRPNGAGSATGAVVAQTTGLTVGSSVVTSATTSMVIAATSGGAIRLRPNGSGSASGEAILLTSGQFQVTQSAPLKPGGGPWADSSDARIKTVSGEYESGLDEITKLRPVRYAYNGNDEGHAGMEGQEFIGLVAQEAEGVMPEMVSRSAGKIDGKAVDDLRILDTGPLIFALVNAVRELTARLKVLEHAQ